MTTVVDHRAAFWQFHTDNPEVEEFLRMKALDAKFVRGYNHIGIKFLYEMLRWETYSPTTGHKYKLPAAYTAGYARLIMEREPRLKGFFRTAKSGFDV